MKRSSANKFKVILFIVITLIALIRIGLNYQHVSETVDEYYHIERGMYLWETNTILHPEEQPILTRYLQGVIPYFTNYIPDSEYHLTLARLSTLPFLILCIFSIFLLARSLFNNEVALWSIFLFSIEPNILAHSGLVTTDIPFTAVFLFNVLLGYRWLKTPTLKTTLILGFATGVLLTTKHSAIGYWGLTMFGYCFLRILNKHKIKQIIIDSGVITVISIITILCLYQFQIEPVKLNKLRDIFPFINLPNPLIIKMPFYEYIKSLKTVLIHNINGHRTFFMGEIKTHGWWYFFPVSFLTKTLIPHLSLFFLSIYFVWRDDLLKKQYSILIIPFLSILLIAMLANINIGIRHILPIYGSTSIISGYILFKLIHTVGVYRYFSIAVFMTLIFTTLHSQKQLIAYTNAFAGSNPHKIFVNSNLDWGQDYYKLAELKKMGIEELWVAYRGPQRPRKIELPNIKELKRHQIVNGWVLISVRYLMGHKGYYWLHQYEPVKKISPILFLYYIAPEKTAASPERDRIKVDLSINKL